MRVYRSLTAKVDMVLERGEVFVRPFGGDFVHISEYEPPKRNPAKALFESCLRECLRQEEDGFHSSDDKQISEAMRTVEEYAKEQGRLAVQVASAYDRWVKA